MQIQILFIWKIQIQILVKHKILNYVTIFFLNNKDQSWSNVKNYTSYGILSLPLSPTNSIMKTQLTTVPLSNFTKLIAASTVPP